MLAGLPRIPPRLTSPVGIQHSQITSFQEYSVTLNRDGDINVKYDNDGGTRDVVVDWLKVDNQNPRQAENRSGS